MRPYDTTDYVVQVEDWDTCGSVPASTRRDLRQQRCRCFRCRCAEQAYRRSRCHCFRCRCAEQAYHHSRYRCTQQLADHGVFGAPPMPGGACRRRRRHLPLPVQLLEPQSLLGGGWCRQRTGEAPYSHIMSTSKCPCSHRVSTAQSGSRWLPR